MITHRSAERVAYSVDGLGFREKGCDTEETRKVERSILRRTDVPGMFAMSVVS
jgi:hypothetical protein